LEIKVVKKTDSQNNTTDNHTVASANELKPFTKPNAENLTKTGKDPFHPYIPRRVIDIPGQPKRSDHMLSMDNDANRLTVGQNISLNGEIVACEKLIVEGHVEATLNDARVIEVSQGGCFKGNADVNEASISGKFIGTLVAKDLLTIRKGGHVEGSIRYGRIIIEAGGEITGDMASLEDQKNEPENPGKSAPD
jgi:cytoskeletal protein CcmA (bactofilin family)